MRVTAAALTFIGCTVLGISVAPFALAAQTTKSQWDGVYSQEQARRGEPLYTQHCAACHGSDLSGGEMAPALAGGEFSANWNELTLGDLFERIRVSMPQTDPNALGRAQKVDILAYMLYRGNYPAGQTDLPMQTEVLRTINFVATRPSGN